MLILYSNMCWKYQIKKFYWEIFIKVFSIFMCLGFCLHAFMCTMCTPSIHGRQKRSPNPLELVLQTIVSCYVGAGNWTLVLWKSSVLNWLSHFSSPYQGLFSIKSFANKSNWIFHFLKSCNHLISLSCFLDKNISGKLVRMERFVLLLILGKMLLFFPHFVYYWLYICHAVCVCNIP